MNNDRCHIKTFTGKTFYPLAPKVQDIDLLDIAHSLSNQCRFVGHCIKFYSVAQHCVLVSMMCDPEDALWGLLHDSPEAYLYDVATPVKRMPEMEPYRLAEQNLMNVIVQAFDLGPIEPVSVKLADKRMLVTEQRDLTTAFVNTSEFVPYPDFKITPWTPDEARDAYLARFRKITGPKAHERTQLF